MSEEKEPVMSPVDSPCSAAVDSLFAALAKAQGEITAAEKGELNPHFNKSYADLADVWAACRKPLSANGLSVTQIPRLQGNTVIVRTILGHGSGQWIASELSASAQQSSPQGIGSTITYLRRYSLAALVGVAPKGDDDDGNAGSNNNGKPDKGDRGGRGDDAPRPQSPPKGQRAAPPREPAPAAATGADEETLSAELAREIAETADLQAQIGLRTKVRGSTSGRKMTLLVRSFERSISLAQTPPERAGVAQQIHSATDLTEPAKAHLHKLFTAAKQAEGSAS